MRQAEIDWPIWPARVPDDPGFAEYQLGYLDMMQAPWAWDVTVGRKPVTVTACVIDSGIRLDHPDLRANLANPPGINVVGMNLSAWTDIRNNATSYRGVSGTRLGAGWEASALRKTLKPGAQIAVDAIILVEAVCQLCKY